MDFKEQLPEITVKDLKPKTKKPDIDDVETLMQNPFIQSTAEKMFGVANIDNDIIKGMGLDSKTFMSLLNSASQYDQPNVQGVQPEPVEVDNDTIGIRELMTRFQLQVPFGNTVQWEKFGQMYATYVACGKLITQPDEVNMQVLMKLMSGESDITIWEELINVADETHPRLRFNKITKALVDGNASIYGFPDITFRNLETLINSWIKETCQENNELIANNVWDGQNLWHFYNYRVTCKPIDENQHEFQITLQLYLNPVNTQFPDLKRLGLYPQNNPPPPEEKKEEADVRYEPKPNDINYMLDDEEEDEMVLVENE